MTHNITIQSKSWWNISDEHMQHDNYVDNGSGCMDAYSMYELVLVIFNFSGFLLLHNFKFFIFFN